MTCHELLSPWRRRAAARVCLATVVLFIAGVCWTATVRAQTKPSTPGPGGLRPGILTRPGADLPASGVAGPTEEQLKQLVVMLVVKLGDRTFNGAGLIFGQRGDQLYIVTAKHVVREGLQQAESVRVRFRWLPGESKDAKVLDDFDDSLDIAVLAVSGLSSLSVPNLVWNALASPSRVKPGQDVIPIGYPDGRAWFTPQLRSKVQEVTGQYVEFQGELHAGNSGGALVTDDWSIVAVVSQIRPPTNQSSRIDRAIEKLKEWGYPVALTERPSPAAGSRSGPTDQPAGDRVSVSGSWDLIQVHPDNTVLHGTLSLVQQGTMFAGKVDWGTAHRPGEVVSGTVEGEHVQFLMKYPDGLEGVYEGVMTSRSRMNGSTQGGGSQARWSATLK